MNQTNARFGNAFTLETERLYLAALTAPQLGLWLENVSLLEEQLQCRYGGQELEGFFRRIVSGQLPAVRQAGDAYLWHTFWWIIDKKDGEAVGTIDFKNPSNNRGETEIGYGLGKNRRGRGYMTETVQVLCAWALEQPGVRRILAETEPTNTASQNVLRRCGFVRFRSGENDWWKLERCSGTLYNKRSTYILCGHENC